MTAWKPKPTLITSFLTFLLIAALFITLGVIILVKANDIEEHEIRYDNKCTIG